MDKNSIYLVNSRNTDCDSDEPSVVGYFSTEEDAKEYCRLENEFNGLDEDGVPLNNDNVDYYDCRFYTYVEVKCLKVVR